MTVIEQFRKRANEDWDTIDAIDDCIKILTATVNELADEWDNVSGYISPCSEELRAKFGVKPERKVR